MSRWGDFKLVVKTAETSAVDQNNELPKAGRMRTHARDERTKAASQPAT